MKYCLKRAVLYRKLFAVKAHLAWVEIRLAFIRGQLRYLDAKSHSTE